MARMPDQLPNVSVPRGGGGARMPDIDVSSGTRQLAATLDNIASDMTERRLQARAVDDQLALAAAGTRYRQTQTERLLQEGDALPDEQIDGFADRYETTAREAAAAEIEALPERLRQRGELFFNDAASDLRLRAFDVEHGRRQARQGRLLDEVVRGEGAVVFADATQYAAALDRSTQALESSGLPEGAQAQILAALPRSLANWRMLGLIDKAPRTAIRELEAGEWNGVMEVEDIARHLDAANREQARIEAEAERRRAAWLQREQARLRVVMEDDLASLQATGRGVGLSLGEVERVYGAEAATAYTARRRTAEETHTLLQRWRFQSPAEIAADVSRMAPRAGQTGFAAAQERHAAFSEVAQEVITARVQDPAAAAIEADPVLAQQMEALTARSTPPAQRRAILAQMTDRQTRLGVPGGAQRLTTNAQAAAWAGRIRGAAPAERTRAIEEVADETATLYGPQASQALAEIARVAEMPELGAIAAIPDLAGRRRAARALSGPEPELSQSQRRSLNARLDSDFAPLARSLANTPGGADRLAQARAAAERVAAAEIAAGVRPEDAARGAAQLYTNQYQFRSGLRMPRTWAGQDLNAGDIADAADRRLEEIAEAGSFALPAGRGDVAAGDQARASADSFRQVARWVSAPNDRGLLLVDEYGDVINDADGAPIAASWDELRAARTRREAEEDERPLRWQLQGAAPRG